MASHHPCLLQPADGNVKMTFPHHHNSGEKVEEIKYQQRKPITILRSGNRLRRELESSISCLKCSKEDATKWNPSLNNEASNKLNMIGGMKHLEDKKTLGDCNFGFTNLQEEHLRAQKSINKLKATHKSSKKRENLEDKKVLWRCRECEKIETMLYDLKDKLARERRSRERMELLNTKLVHDLTKADLSAKRFMANYKEEKKGRKQIEEVCNELAMQVREDTTKLERLLSDSVKICEEVEEEREMMEMVELWREERVQMKLLDAQFLLEDKYNQMVQLIAFLEMFLRSRGAELDTTELEDAQLIKQVVESVNIKDIVELSYDFSKLDFTVSTLEDLRKDNIEEGMIKPDSHTPLNSPLSTIHTESLDEELLNKNSILHQNSPSSDYNIELDQTNLENFGYHEDQKFRSMPQRGDTYSVNSNQEKDILVSGKACLESLRTRVNGIGYVSEGEVLQKASFTSKKLRSSPNGGITISTAKTSQHKRLGGGRHKEKECRRLRFPTSSIQNAGTNSQCQGSVEDSFNPTEQLDPGNSTYNMNPHIIRGMRGCTKCPPGVPKSNFKVTPVGKE